MNKLFAFIDLFRKGSAVADAARAKEKAAIVGTLSVFLYAAAEIAKEFGYDLGVSPEMAQHLAMFIGSVSGLFVTYATSDKVGLPPKREAPDDASPGGPDVPGNTPF